LTDILLLSLQCFHDTQGYLPLYVRLSIMIEAGIVLRALHTELRAAHFDVKPENYLVDWVDGRTVVVLCDLGYAQTAASLRAIQAVGGKFYPVSEGAGPAHMRWSPALACWQRVACWGGLIMHVFMLNPC
jgi:serine/threonine protein kinase